MSDESTLHANISIEISERACHTMDDGLCSGERPMASAFDRYLAESLRSIAEFQNRGVSPKNDNRALARFQLASSERDGRLPVDEVLAFLINPARDHNAIDADDAKKERDQNTALIGDFSNQERSLFAEDATARTVVYVIPAHRAGSKQSNPIKNKEIQI